MRDMRDLQNLKWLEARLERRARDARQAETYTRAMHPGGYPQAQRLAEVHAEAAAVYERALTAVRKEFGDST